MKKILRLRKCLALGAVILLITSIYVSCRKDRSQDLPLSKTELIAEAQGYFEDEVVNLPQLNDNNLRHSLDKTPCWFKCSLFQRSLKSILKTKTLSGNKAGTKQMKN